MEWIDIPADEDLQLSIEARDDNDSIQTLPHADRVETHFDKARPITGRVSLAAMAIAAAGTTCPREMGGRFETILRESLVSGESAGCTALMKEIVGQAAFCPAATWMVVFQPEPDWPAVDCGTIQGVTRSGGIGSIQNVGVIPEHRGLGLVLRTGAACVAGLPAGWNGNHSAGSHRW